jgi:hypothetical protein
MDRPGLREAGTMLGHRLNTHSADACSFAGVCAPVSRVCWGVGDSYRRPPRRLEAILAPLARAPAFLLSDLGVDRYVPICIPSVRARA